MSQESDDRPDTPPGPPRRRWWLWLPAGCLGFLVLLFLLGSLVVSGRASSRWKEFGIKNAELRARVQSNPYDREPLEPPAVEGNAWDQYVAASSALAKMSDEERNAIDEVRSGKFTPEKQKKAYDALDAHAADLEALRKAAHAGSWRDGVDWDLGWAAPLDWLGPFRMSARMLELSARRRRGAGDLTGAIDDVAAAAQMGVDTASTGPAICALVGHAILRISATEAAVLLADPALTPGQAARIERLFERAEAALRPLDQQLDADHLLMNETMTALAEGRGDFTDLGFPAAARLLAWRHGFSWRIVAADIDDACARATDECRVLSARPWSEAQLGHDRIEQRVSGDPILGLVFTSSLALDRADRGVRARLRLLRALAHERATGTPLSPIPEDPFTRAPLHRLDDAGTLRLWSEWTDGDQSGMGGFQDDPSSGSGDIVVEWKHGK